MVLNWPAHHFLKCLLFTCVRLCSYSSKTSSRYSCLCVCPEGSPSFLLHWEGAMYIDAAHPYSRNKALNTESKHSLPLPCTQLYYMSNWATVMKAYKYSLVKIWRVLFLGIYFSDIRVLSFWLCFSCAECPECPEGDYCSNVLWQSHKHLYNTK